MTRQDRAIIRVALEDWYTGVETSAPVCIAEPEYPTGTLSHHKCDPMTCLDAAYEAVEEARVLALEEAAR